MNRSTLLHTSAAQFRYSSSFNRHCLVASWGFVDTPIPSRLLYPKYHFDRDIPHFSCLCLGAYYSCYLSSVFIYFLNLSETNSCSPTTLPGTAAQSAIANKHHSTPHPYAKTSLANLSSLIPSNHASTSSSVFGLPNASAASS